MINITNVALYNLDNAMRGARNPMNSWNRQDSEFKKWDEGASEIYGAVKSSDPDAKYYCLGENDLGLAKRLRTAGSDHRKFVRQIMLSVDIDAPFYWWKEFDTYKVGTVANSCSTMHKLMSKAITMSDFSTDTMSPRSYERMRVYVNELEAMRQEYLAETDAVAKKQIWRDIIQLLPESFNQKRTVTFNYETLINIHHSRQNHKLSEWIEFCKWIDKLPYAAELICD